MISPFYIFRLNNHDILFNGENLSLSRLSENEKSRLSTISNNNKELDEIDKKLLCKYNLITQQAPLKISKKQIPVSNIALFVTQNCNLKCIYCYGEYGKYGKQSFMSERMAHKSIDWLVLQSKDQKDLTVSLFGGEPLLNMTLIKSIIKYAKSKEKYSGKRFRFNLNTNGTLLSTNTIKYLWDNNVIITVSVDGPKEIQDTQRPFVTGSGTYDSIKPKIKELLKVMPDSSCRAVVLGENNIVDIENHLLKLGFKKVFLSFPSYSLFGESIKIKDHKRNTKQFIEKSFHEAEAILKAINTEDIEYLKSIKKTSLLLSRIERITNKHKKLYPCGAGRSSVAISTNGKVFLCHRFVGIEKFLIGNILKKELNRDKYHKSPLKNNTDCRDCFAKYLCAGGCYHDNISFSGSESIPSKDMCELMKLIVVKSLLVYSQLNKTNIELLRKNKIIEEKLCPFDF